MSAAGPALQTLGLSKSFGALWVANAIDFALERGARQALIGPNGAGKTSFVNLVSGALEPSSGRILLGGSDITGLTQAQRVKRGLARTFQINQLFRGLCVLENVALAVAERHGVAGNFLWPAGARRAVTEEAYALLERLGIEGEALRPVRELAYGRQRLVEIGVALGLSPKVLLLDEPAAGVPSGETGTIIDVIERLPPDLVAPHHRARHGSGVPPGAAHHRSRPGRHSGRGNAARDCRGRAGARGLSRRARARMTPHAGLHIENLRAGYGDTVVLDGLSLDLPPGGTLAVLGRNGVGKTTLLATIMGHTTLHGGAIEFAGVSLGPLAPYLRARLGLGFVPQEREIFRSLTVEENLLVASRPGRWSLARVYDFFPALAERRRNRGSALSGGEQQMLSIARALMGNPSLLLMDEPLEGLAPVIVDTVLQGLDRLKREEKLALLLVEQHARLALEFAERAIVLDRGRIVHAGDSRALIDRPETLAALMGVTQQRL